MFWLYVTVKDSLAHSETYLGEATARAAFQDMIDVLRDDPDTSITLKSGVITLAVYTTKRIHDKEKRAV